MNAAYVRQLSKRVIDAKEDRARDGYHNGQVPFGYLRPEYPKAPDGAPSTWKPPRTPVRTDPVNFPALVRIGELAAQGWLDTAIANELATHYSTTPRYGERLLTKDTIAAIRRLWFPREFAPGCGHGTIETPSGDLVEGRHRERLDGLLAAVEAQQGPREAALLPPEAVADLPVEVATGNAPFALAGKYHGSQNGSNGSPSRS